MALFCVGFLVLDRRFRQMEQLIERKQRLIEGLSALAVTTPHPGTGRLERRTTDLNHGTGAHRKEQSPLGTPRSPDPSPRGTQRLGDPSPRGSKRLEGSSRPPGYGQDQHLAATPAPLLPDAVITQPGDPWEASHRIIFTPEQGRPESWLVMMLVAPAGGRRATTKSEWTAGVMPAWQCNASGTWSYHGKPTPEGSRGKVSVETFALS